MPKLNPSVALILLIGACAAAHENEALLRADEDMGITYDASTSDSGPLPDAGPVCEPPAFGGASGPLSSVHAGEGSGFVSAVYENSLVLDLDGWPIVTTFYWPNTSALDAIVGMAVTVTVGGDEHENETEIDLENGWRLFVYAKNGFTRGDASPIEIPDSNVSVSLVEACTFNSCSEGGGLGKNYDALVTRGGSATRIGIGEEISSDCDSGSLSVTNAVQFPSCNVAGPGGHTGTTESAFFFRFTYSCLRVNEG